MKKLIFVIAASALVTCGQSLAQDGFRTTPGDAYCEAIVVQQVQTQFGDNNPPDLGSELDAAYAYNDANNLYLMLTGNLESNFNKLNIFIDSIPNQGENTITPDVDNGGNNPTNDNWANKHAGLIFDAGFAPDFLIICRNGFAGGDRFDLDFSSVGNNSVVESAFDVFGGTLEGSNGTLPNGVSVGFDNSNIAGVAGGTMAADTAAAEAVETGVELVIPLTAIGASIGDTIKIAAHVNASNHDFLSNQTLGALAPPQGNLGGDGLGNFIGDLSLIDFTSFVGDQFFSVDIVTPTIPPDMATVTAGVTSSGSSADICDEDSSIWTVQSTTFVAAFSPPPVAITFEGTANPVGGTDVTLRLVGGPEFGNDAAFIQLRMFNFSTGAYVGMPFIGQPDSDNTVYEFTNPVADFVGPNGELRAEITCAKTVVGPVRLRMDQVGWQIQ